MPALIRALSITAFIACMSCAHAQQAVSAPRADGALTPLMVYDAPGDRCPPLALVSPGAGGSERGMAYLGDALGKRGWRVVVMGHKESGMDALRGDMRRTGFHRGLENLVADPNAYRGRFMDIDAALTWSEQRCHAPFKALIGHSMGARTVLLEAGARSTLGVHGKNLFDAYVAMSEPGADAVFPAGAARGVTAPMLMLTGTRDDTIDRKGYQERTQSFDALGSRCAWLGVIDGSTHMNFAGRGDAGSTETTTLALTTGFLDALRSGHCGRPPALAGVRIRSK
jgi:predicted dienelactone hydrolase